MTEDRSCPIDPLATHAFYVKCNMETVNEMIPIEISMTPLFMENVFVGADYSPRRFESTQIYLNNYVMFLTGLTRKFQELIE
jgi:hypothetical protein